MEKSNALATIDSNDLTLWKADIPIGDGNIIIPPIESLVKHSLWPTKKKKIKDAFNGMLEDECVRVIVELPILSTVEPP
jgi:hypothetical protein